MSNGLNASEGTENAVLCGMSCSIVWNVLQDCVKCPAVLCGMSCSIVWNFLQYCVECPAVLCEMSCSIVWNVLQNNSFLFITVNILHNVVIIMYTQNMTAKRSKSGVRAHRNVSQMKA